MIRIRSGTASTAAALLALLLLSFATVQSVIMRANTWPPDAMTLICGSHPTDKAAPDERTNAVAWPPTEHRSGAGHPHAASCPFCAAAAHVPILEYAFPLPHAASFLFTAFQLPASHGPRGPPARRARARGPPADPPIA
jgi:hypothetical protein